MTPEDIRSLKSPDFPEHSDIPSVFSYIERHWGGKAKQSKVAAIVGAAINTAFETVAATYEEELNREKYDVD